MTMSLNLQEVRALQKVRIRSF